MLTYFAVISILSSAAWAQTSLIPTGISSSCSGFLTALNSDSSLGGCIAPLVNATSAYAPTATSSSPTAASVTAALDAFCAMSSSSCPPSTIRTKLAEFYAACPKELGSEPNADVIRTYDTFYVLTPLKEAVCSKDDSGKYCVTEATRGSSNSKRELSVRGPGDPQTAFVPNVTNVASTNMLFFFLRGDLPEAKLCTTCTKNVLGAYMGFESTIPYGPGLSNSVLLRGQIDLYQGVVDTCGKNFLGGAVQAAAGIGANGVFGESASANGASGSRLPFSSILAALVAIGCALVL